MSRTRERTSGSEVEPEIVVAIDFGTTFSGFSYAVLTDMREKHVEACHVIEDWPGQGKAGTRHYCKTQTCVWYLQDTQPEMFKFANWGNQATVEYKKRLQLYTQSRNLPSSEISENTSSTEGELLAKHVGYFITDFKLGLAGQKLDLPRGLELRRVITDYLRHLTNWGLKQVTNALMKVDKEQIRFCLTVPAMWSEEAKQIMKDCAESAGLVQGAHCSDEGASIHELVIVLEPEAASVYCHQTLKSKSFSNGDQFLVVDVGGGTVDMVLHEKIGSTTRNTIQVKEVRECAGAPWGGSHVDRQFFAYLRTKIPCFSNFEVEFPAKALEIHRWWGDIKTEYSGDADYFCVPIPSNLSYCWEKQDELLSPGQPHAQRRDYSELIINSIDMAKIFDPVVDNILKVIQDQILPGMSALLVVGGFSSSPYLRGKIEKAFSPLVKDQRIVFPPHPGRAVLQGALSFGDVKDWAQLVNARTVRRTYGFDTTLPFKEDRHPKEYLVHEAGTNRRRCDNIFSVLVRRGEQIPLSRRIRQTCRVFYPANKKDEAKESEWETIEMNLYATSSLYPRFVTDVGVKKVAKCIVPVPPRTSFPESDEPKIELLLRFGGTRIVGYATPKNYTWKEGEDIRRPIESKGRMDNSKFRPIIFEWISEKHATL